MAIEIRTALCPLHAVCRQPADHSSTSYRHKAESRAEVIVNTIDDFEAKAFGDTVEDRTARETLWVFMHDRVAVAGRRRPTERLRFCADI